MREGWRRYDYGCRALSAHTFTSSLIAFEHIRSVHGAGWHDLRSYNIPEQLLNSGQTPLRVAMLYRLVAPQMLKGRKC